MTLPDLSRPGDERSRRICYCVRVHEATILRAIAEGFRSVEAIRERTRAATGCGTCRFDLEVLLRRGATSEDGGSPGKTPED